MQLYVTSMAPTEITVTVFLIGISGPNCTHLRQPTDEHSLNLNISINTNQL